MKGSRLLVAGVLLVFLTTGCGRSSDNPPRRISLPATPEEAVQLVHMACLDGEYARLAPLFTDGARLWKVDPAAFKSWIDRVCQNSAGAPAPYIRIDYSEVKGEGAMLQTFSHMNEDYSDGGRYSEWQLIKGEGGWRIASLLST